MAVPDPLHRPRRREGFTLVELLTVIAIIGILAAVLIPAVGAARRSVDAAKSRSRFAGWITAIETFRSQYGFYPTFGAAGSGDVAIPLADNADDFVGTLAGRQRDGKDLPAGGYARRANKNLVAFYTFAPEEFGPTTDADTGNDGKLVDAFGNPDLHLVVDRDGNGVIDVGAFAALPEADRPKEPLNARVAIFATTTNAKQFPDRRVVTSW